MTPEQFLQLLHDLVPLGIIGAIRHSAWVIKIVLSLFWRDIRATGPLPYTKVGAAMTVKGEPAATFKLVLESLLRERINQVCITFDKDETELMALTNRFFSAHRNEIDIRWKIVTEKGKRRGLKAAIEMVDGMDIIICMDSDTIFGKGVKEGIMHAFSKPGIGGVTVAQRTHNPHRLVHYLFDIRLKLRYVFEIPGQALGGHVSCLSGRCSAYLAEPLKQIASNLTTEEWMGIKKTGGGEDKCLTTFLLDMGYKCAVVTGATVYTRPESSLAVYFSQSLRWARNSWFSDLRAIFTRRPWMVRDPILLFYTLDRMMSTFTLIVAAWYAVLLLLMNRWETVALLFAWWMISRSIKLIPWLLETRKVWVIVPYALVTFWLSFLKVHALVTLWETGWLTRGSQQNVRAISKMLLNNGYRLITASIIFALGVHFAYGNDVWLADMPLVAEAGHFYRPENDGLGIMQDVFPLEGNRRTLLVLNNPSDVASLQAAVPALARLGDELAEELPSLQVVRAADLTEQQVIGANVIFAERPLPVTPLLQQVAALYDRPAMEDRLLNSEPFADAALTPIRVVRAPWKQTSWMLLADSAGTMRYRIRGEVIEPAQALALLQTDPAQAAYFEPDTLPDQARLLAHLDSFLPELPDEIRLKRAYRIILTPDIDDSGLALHLQGAAVGLLRPGAQLQIALNQGDTGGLMLPDASPVTMSLGVYISGVAGRSADPREVILTLAVNRADILDATLEEGSFWRQFEANSFITWDKTFRWSTPGLDQYPYPFINLTDTAPVVIFMSDTPSDLELRLVLLMVLRLAANGLPGEDIYLMQPAALDDTILKTAHVLIPVADAERGLTRLLDERFEQTRGSGVLDILPNTGAGFVWMSTSPWNEERTILMSGGLTEAGQLLAGSQLLSLQPLSDIYTDVVIIQPEDYRVPYDGFDRYDFSTRSVSFTDMPPLQ